MTSRDSKSAESLEAWVAVVPAAGGTRGSDSVEISSSPLFRSSRGKSFLERIISGFEAAPVQFSEVLVGIRSKDLRQAEFLSSTFHSHLKITFVICDDTASPMGTVKRLLSSTPEGYKVLLQLGDTFATIDWKRILMNPVGALITSDPDAIARLDTLDSHEGTLYALTNNSTTGNNPVGLVGIYWFRKNAAALEKTNKPLESLLFAAGDETPVGIESDGWIDADYSDRFSKQNDTFESRNFNSVTKDSLGIYVTKTSTFTKKLDWEHRFIQSLPAEIAGLFPSIRSFERSEERATVTMDYWPFPNLSDLYCARDLSEDFWLSAMGKIKDSMDLLHVRAPEDTDDGEFAFGGKTLARLEELANIDEDWRILVESGITINSDPCNRPREIVRMGVEVLSNEISLTSITHGDFCFSNILIDTQTLTLKLVDPRGGFSGPSVFGPEYYDKAKLAHSIIGGYDLMLKNYFQVTRNSVSDYKLEISYPPHHHVALQAFRDVFCQNERDYLKLKLASGLILMSIPPLHLEDAKRALGFFLKGLQDANSALLELEQLHERSA